MDVLALEAYYGGSHRAFLDGWVARGRHAWTLLHLPAHKWKWRMRHAAVTLADEVRARVAAGQRWDAVFCSDMLNLAEFSGLAPEPVRRLPRVAYFHENQLTYPARHVGERDLHFGFTNFTTALAADAVWFNSAYHRDDFLAALEDLLRRMPDHAPLGAVADVRRKAHVQPPGIDDFPPRGPRPPGPLRILWAARWEHDKDPELFFAALRRLQERRVAFRVSVIGEQFEDTPAVFDAARAALGERIDRWGYQATRAEYVSALGAADVIVSTAAHEFFGLSVAEAIAAGCVPLLPRRLAYPELLGLGEDATAEALFYDGGADVLADRLAKLAAQVETGGLGTEALAAVRRRIARLAWSHRAPQLDVDLAAVVTSAREGH